MFLKKINKFFQTLTFKIIAWYLFLSTLTLSLFFLISFYFYSQALIENDHKHLSEVFNNYAESIQLHGVETFMNLQDINEIKNFLKTQLKNEEEATEVPTHFVILIDKNLKNSFFYPQKFSHYFAQEEIEKTLMNAKDGWNYIKTKKIDNDVEVLSKHLSPNLILQVGINVSDRDKLLETFIAIFTIILLCSIVFGIISGILFSNQILKPLRNLSRAINKITSGESKQRISAGQSRDELSVLVQQFNLMLDQIEKKDRSMRETLDIISHELRTPMTRFKVMAEYALAKGEDLETTKESIRELIEGVDEILTEFKMIADITTMESGVKNLDLKEISINKLIEEIIDLYGIVAEQKHVEIIFSPKEDIQILVDKRKLRQALANIVDNSIKYSPENKSMIIEVSKLNHTIEIHITDQGIGIAAHEIPLIFNRLYRGENSRHEKGMGLGLSLANLIVAAHEGKIEVISELGRGTTFIVSLPVAR